MVDSTVKRYIIFTWDDNSSRHYNYIGPLFQKYGIRCTFYVNPGWKSFKKRYLSGYKFIDQLGFEVGSHGYTHKNMIKLSKEEYRKQIIMSQQLLQEWLSHPITSFAFPHHKYTEEMLMFAKKYYLETRNTLYNSIRFSIKRSTTITDIVKIVNDTEASNKNLVFSGHSVALNSDELNNSSNNIGYEPILITTLERIIQEILYKNDIETICTLSEAASIINQLGKI